MEAGLRELKEKRRERSVSSIVSALVCNVARSRRSIPHKSYLTPVKFAPNVSLRIRT